MKISAEKVITLSLKEIEFNALRGIVEYYLDCEGESYREHAEEFERILKTIR